MELAFGLADCKLTVTGVGTTNCVEDDPMDWDSLQWVYPLEVWFLELIE